MSANRNNLLTSLLSLVMLVAPGCGGGTEGPELGHVEGTVTLDGSPLEGVQVIFQPTDGRPAFGTTDALGNFILAYTPTVPGCKVGTNRVLIGHGEGDAQEDEIEGDNLVQTPGKQPPVIPARYNEQSGIEVDVQPGENSFRFDLTSDPH